MLPQGGDRSCGVCSRPVVGDCMVSSGRLVCQVLLVSQSLHLFINQVLPQAVHDLLCVRGQPQWHLLHLPQQAHLREGLQRECAEVDARAVKESFHNKYYQTCSECGCRISYVYYTLDSGKVVCEADYRVTYQHYPLLSRTTLGRKPWTSARSAPDLWRASW